METRRTSSEATQPNFARCSVDAAVAGYDTGRAEYSLSNRSLGQMVERVFFSSPSTFRVEDLVKRGRHKRYICLSAEVFNSLAQEFPLQDPDHFKYFPISWEKFPDGTDNITISGFSPQNEIAGEHVIFFASFHNNDVTLSEISVLIVLLQSFIESLTIVLPFYPVGTNERVEVEGKVATANTYATLLSNLPSIGRPIRIMIYDIHALQNRFYFHGSVTPSLHTSIPLLFKQMTAMGVRCACFPDDGAAKRFGKLFREAGWELVVCGKIRDGNSRRVTVQDGDPQGER